MKKVLCQKAGPPMGRVSRDNGNLGQIMDVRCTNSCAVTPRFVVCLPGRDVLFPLDCVRVLLPQYLSPFSSSSSKRDLSLLFSRIHQEASSQHSWAHFCAPDVTKIAKSAFLLRVLSLFSRLMGGFSFLPYSFLSLSLTLSLLPCSRPRPCRPPHRPGC